jgi:DedD protein
MELHVRERLVGALVLVAIVVLLVPAILTGRGSAPSEPPAQPTRRVEVPLGDAVSEPEEQVLVPEPVADEPVTDAPPEPAVTASPGGEPTAKETRAAAPNPTAAQQPVATPPPARPAEPPQPEVVSQTPAWAVQLGAFSNRAKAEQLVADLRKRRYAAFMLEYRASGQVLYRVRVGPEQDRARAEEIAARLAKDGFQPVVARHP